MPDIRQQRDVFTFEAVFGREHVIGHLRGG